MEPIIWHSKLPAFEPTPTFVDEALLAHADDYPTKVAVTTASGRAPAMSELLRAPSPSGAARDPDDVAFMFPSGGTSGLPKVVAHRHRGVSAWLQAFSRTPTVRLEPTDVVAVLAPFTHMFGIA